MTKSQHKPRIDAPSFNSATSEGEVTHKGGYHQPGDAFYTRSRGRVSCGCKKTTEKGMYRDVLVEMPDGRRVRFYHQSPVVVESTDGRLRLDSHGYKAKGGMSGSSTTKERINSELPRGFRLYQEDFVWYVSLPDGDRVEFEDGMIINPAEGTAYDPKA